ncbi:MAG: TIR domain-containing protein, partial [Promethearchaeota archaeon]
MSVPRQNYKLPKEKWPKGSLIAFRPVKTPIYSMDITKDRNTLVFGGEGGLIKFLDLKEGKITRILDCHDDDILCVRFNEDNTKLLSTSEDELVKLWDLEKIELINEFSGHEGAIFSAIFVPNEKYIISASEDKLAKIWSLNTFRVYRNLKGHKGSVNSIDITPDGKIIATAGTNTIKLWKWGAIRPFKTIHAHDFSINDIKIDSEGEYLVSASVDKKVKVWRIDNGELIYEFNKHEGSVSSVDISDDRKYIASGGGDKALYIWSLDGSEVYGPFIHESYVRSVKFIPKTNIVVSGDFHGNIVMWDFKKLFGKFETAIKEINSITQEEKRSDQIKNLKIFISYATADSQRFKIAQIAKELDKYEEIRAVLFWEENMGDDIYAYMNDNIGICDVLIVFCSANSKKSEAVRLEWMSAFKLGKKIIPVFDDDDNIPPLLTTKLGLQFPDKDEDFNEFIEDLHSLIIKKIKNL